jgi:hypothetical protein
VHVGDPYLSTKPTESHDQKNIQGAFEEQLAHLQVLTVDGDVKNVPWSKGHGPWE